MASRWGDGDDAKDATATELIIPTTSNYISHESVLVDTPDHEDHFFRCVRYHGTCMCAPALCSSLLLCLDSVQHCVPRCASSRCPRGVPLYASSRCPRGVPRCASSRCPRGASLCCLFLASANPPLTLRPTHPTHTHPPPSSSPFSPSGIMFDVQACSFLPIEEVGIESLWVRGQIGPVTVWSRPGR